VNYEKNQKDVLFYETPCRVRPSDFEVTCSYNVNFMLLEIAGLIVKCSICRTTNVLNHSRCRWS